MADYIKRDKSLLIWLSNLAYEQVQKVPAADVRPVVRAAWQSWEQDKPPCKWYSCDYCGFHALSKSNYCPNCGARMDGGVNDV